MKFMTHIVCLAAAIVPTAAFTSAGQGTGAEPVTTALSAETRVLLIREMQAIAQAMGVIHRGIVTGDHESVASEAQKIHNSFVLAQEITQAQREEIASRLPQGFIVADRAFHGLAAQLAEAGRQGDPRLERLWFQEMTRACQACHADYAGSRFPGLAPDEGGGRHPDSTDTPE
jgi:hypothetical protein